MPLPSSAYCRLAHDREPNRRPRCSVLVNQEGSDFREKCSGVRHGFLPVRRTKGILRCIGTLELKRNGSINGSVVVAILPGIAWGDGQGTALLTTSCHALSPGQCEPARRDRSYLERTNPVSGSNFLFLERRTRWSALTVGQSNRGEHDQRFGWYLREHR